MKTNSLDFDAQALREKILDLAMRGKLVKQDPNDEPASVLLEKIKAEKAKLVKEGKIKKNKPLPEITDDEKPFDIPDSWEWVRLGEIGNYIQRGRSPKYDKESLDHPIISQKCVQWNSINIEDAKHITEDFFKKLEPYRFIQKNDILWNSTGTGTVGRLNIVKDNYSHVPVDSHVTLMRMNQFIDSDYIYYFLRSPQIQKNLGDYLTGTTKQKELGLTNILNINIPLPPVSEQSRIAAKIAQLFALLRKVESFTQQYAELQTLLKSKVLDLAMRGKLVKQDPNDEPASVLLEKIKAEKEQLIKEKKIKKSKPLPPISDEEKPFEIPDSWEWVRLGDVGLIATGNTPTKNNSDFYGGATPFIKPADIQNLIINYNTKDFLSEKGEQKGRLAYKNDILVTCIGNLGRNNIINRKVAYNQQINGISPLIVSSSLLHYFMLSSFFISSMYNYASATTLPILNKTKLSNLIIPLPPLAEQSGIVDKIEMIFSLFCKDESSTQQYENL
ncbi:restriction endonuclease subunit S [Lactobacillus johnsonii]|uniref:restriction endonuclease subunit S n=1 Tax=Lactobacillus johnsonii TaxID=33959 RepID=UPI00130341F5|nr:restriction endonuclease subunit S [Lactobacillus johnsonii]QGY96699.1 restriction endonuclease subunit S [Lactobacillus johnsonii]